MQVRRLPYSGNMNYGRGVNTLTGEVVGLALDPAAPEATTGVGGQEAQTTARVITSHEQLMESMGLSVEASGRYGLFSGSGKFELSEKSAFNAQATFVVASCVVRNAFTMVNDLRLLDDAAAILRSDPKRFQTTYGDSYVRGVQTGGEFYAVFSLISTNTETQTALASELQAEYGGLFASVNFKASFEKARQSSSSKTDLQIWVYQRAGMNEELAVVRDTDEVFARLKAFPRIAGAYPVGYEAEVASYDTLALPMPSPVELEQKEFALQDCARLRLKYATARNDVEFARTNRDYYADLPPDPELNEIQDKYARAITQLMRHARQIAGGQIEPAVFVPAAALPLVNLRRVNPPQTLRVPNLAALPVAKAREVLTGLGLTPDADGRPVKKEDAVAKDVVVGQEPGPDAELPPKGRVRYTFNYVPDNRFRWLTKSRVVNLAALKLNR